MAKAPTLDDYIEARKTALEFELRRDLGEHTSDELFTNKEAAAELVIGDSTWFNARKSAAKTDTTLREPAEKRGRTPLWSRDQVEAVRKYLDDNEGD